MKTLLTTASILALFSYANAAEVRLADCPTEVQTTIQKQSRGGHIDEIEAYNIQGKMLYVAEVELPADRDLKIHVAADGALVKTREDFTLTETPAAVQTTVTSKLADGVVDDVDKEIAGTTATYLVEIDRKGAPDLNLKLSEDGKVLSETEGTDD